MEFEHKITIIGSTGSIGTQTLEIARTYPGIRVLGLSAHSNIALLERQTREFRPEVVCVVDAQQAAAFKRAVADLPVRVVSGAGGLSEVACADGAQTVVTAVVGIAGLLPTLDAIRAKKNIALANKETLVTAGHIVTRLCAEYGVQLLPVDSEHSAIFQSMQGNEGNAIRRILLTASGGPFFGKTKAELAHVTPEQALKHPNWNMGAKVTVDSSTLVNKGLEVIEAKWLFGVEVDQIEVLVHRQSIVHSMVEYADHAVIAQLGTPDMRLPIQYALSWPRRFPMEGNTLDFAQCFKLTFAQPDMETFYALKLAYRAGKEGGLLPCVFNGADEAAVALFLDGKLQFLQIPEAIQCAMEEVPNRQEPSVAEVLEADRAARDCVYRRYGQNFRS